MEVNVARFKKMTINGGEYSIKKNIEITLKGPGECLHEKKKCSRNEGANPQKNGFLNVDRNERYDRMPSRRAR